MRGIRLIFVLLEEVGKGGWLWLARSRSSFAGSIYCGSQSVCGGCSSDVADEDKGLQIKGGLFWFGFRQKETAKFIRGEGTHVIHVEDLFVWISMEKLVRTSSSWREERVETNDVVP